MRVIPLTDRDRIEAFLRRDPFLNLYAIGDLDDFFWPDTQWFGLEEAGALAAVALLYTGEDPPVLLALGAEGDPRPAELASGLAASLPPRLYLHLTPGVAPAFQSRYTMRPHGSMLKMALTRPRLAEPDGRTNAEPVLPEHAEELIRFYEESYPANWFRPRMLESGQYLCIRDQGGIAAAAGVHVYSSRYRVAAIGNVATRPSARGRGLAGAVTEALCRQLAATVDHIGLNVSAENAAAIRCYERIGGPRHAVSEELDATAEPTP